MRKQSIKIFEAVHLLRNVANVLLCIRNSWRISSVAKNENVRFLFAAILLRDDLTEYERDAFLEQLERVTFRIFGIAGYQYRLKAYDYCNLAKNIFDKTIFDAEGDKPFKKEHILDELKKLGKEVEFQIPYIVYRLRDLDVFHHNWQHQFRYLMYKYEQWFFTQRFRGIDTNMWYEIWQNDPAESIAHIVHQDKDNTDAADNIPATKLNSIGNLTLIPPSIKEKTAEAGLHDRRKLYEHCKDMPINSCLNIAPGKADFNIIKARENQIIGAAKEFLADIDDTMEVEFLGDKSFNQAK